MGYGALRTERKRQGYSQLQMAQLLGLCTRNAYALKERGHRRFTVDEAITIGRLLDQSVEALFLSPEVNKMVTNQNG